MWGFGFSKTLQRLLEQFWEVYMVVKSSRGCYGSPFKIECGVTQGDPVSLTIFTILVDAIVWATFLDVCNPQEAQN